MSYSQPPQYSPEQEYLRPHRGAIVLVLGILGLVVCFILGAVAWSMGNTDLREMREGRMDPTGEGITQAGRICGMISVILNCVAIGIFLIVLMAGGVAMSSSMG